MIRFRLPQTSIRIPSLVAGIVLLAVSGTLSVPRAQDTGALPPAPATEAPRADLSQANEHVRQGNYAEADVVLATLQEQFPDDASLLLMRGEILLQLQRPTDALPLLRRSAEIDADRPRVHFQLGSALLANGDGQGALDAFAREIEVNEDSDVQRMCRLNRSLVLQQIGDPLGAATELEEAMRLAFMPAAFGDLATLYLQAGALDKVDQTLAQGKEAGFRSAQHQYSLGAAYYRQDNLVRARAAFEECLAIDPDFADALPSLAATLERLGMVAEAIPHLRHYLDLRPDAADSAKIAARLREAEKR